MASRKGNSSVSEKWTFNSNVDVDLRENRTLTNAEINLQRNTAFLKALEKINTFFNNIPEKVSRINFDHHQFTATIVDKVLQQASHGSVTTAWYPVEMEGTVDLKIKHDTPVPYTIHIDIDNPVITQTLNGPLVPHIGYKIIGNPRYATLYGLDPKITGHILLNASENVDLPDRGRGVPVTSNMNYVPISRVFSRPVNDGSVLVRTDTDRITPEQTRNRVFPFFY